MELPELSEGIRKIVKTGVIFLVIIILLWIVWILSTGISKLIFRPQVKDLAYGALAQPSFTQLYSPLKSKKWILEGQLPPSQEKVQVFQVIKGQFLEAQQKTILEDLKITGKPEELDSGINKYKAGEATMILNSGEGTFSYKVEYTNPVKNFTFNRLGLSEEDVVVHIQDTLKRQRLWTEDLANGRIETNLLLIDGNNRQKISSANANAAEVSIYRKTGDLFGTGDPLVKLLIGGADRRILEYEYIYYYLNPYGSFYPIRDSDEAWREIQKGKGFSDNIPEQDSVSVNAVELSYWESSLSQSYIQPVWVFSCVGKIGDKEVTFKAYLPAINSAYLVSSQ